MPINCEFDDNYEPSEFVVAEISPNQTFGVSSMLIDTKYYLNAHATKGSTLFVL